MSDNSASPYEDTVFRAVLTPHRSLGRRGFRVLMGMMCLVCTLASIPFFILGAWPVVGFFGLDVLLLYVAFRVSYRSARATEEVVLTHLELLIRKVSHWGSGREWRFNPAWVRLHRETDEDYGLMRLAIVHGRGSLDVGGFLSPEERARFADAFARGLAEARRGPSFD